MKYIIAVLPLIIGFVLDLIIGDPYDLPHPVRLMGKLISALENLFRKLFPNRLILAGTLLSLTVLAVSAAVPFVILLICYSLNQWIGIAVESVLIYYMLAAKCLYSESMKVCKAVENHDIAEARRAVSMIVGRDTDKLDKEGVIRAAVETVAENTSDGVTAPLFYMAFGGAVFGFFYKAANTMDSMLGYKNEKYLHFGRFAAKFDDFMNYIPSRLSAHMMILAAFILKYNAKGAWKIHKRDRASQASPNAAQTESAAAGALDIRLLGDAYYFGRLHHKSTVGDNIRPVESKDIRRVNRLMFCTSAIMLVFAVTVRILLAFLFF
ncbi:MAG: adenosylcobinamide-phosphate synthase CbiB [Clostridium sp.]|nr:adenosylcobinamide-phosphate synthase CbiB [Clostridium sp.]MCM1546991.1 adenosylcobinamide-phosphate synthase CbiB [Ruminococcus sp.]